MWCTEAGGDVKLEIEYEDPSAPATLVDERNPFWIAFRSVLVDDL